jgi:hypothetical protein
MSKAKKSTGKGTRKAKATALSTLKAKKQAAYKPAAKKPAREKKPKQVSALDAAATVLQAAGKPMSCGELIDAMAKQGLWTSPGGKTPASTLYSAILREINKGDTARFRKTGRGQFELSKG